MGIVNHPVEDAVGQRGIADLFGQHEIGVCDFRIVEGTQIVLAEPCYFRLKWSTLALLYGWLISPCFGLSFRS
jgi:hypothetical protein